MSGSLPSDAAAPVEASQTPSGLLGSRLQIQGSMTLSRATELRDAVRDAVGRQASPVEFDLSDVTDIDTAGVQILLLAKRMAEAEDKELQLVGQSVTVLRTLELLRLDGHFGAPAFFLFDEVSP
jgi:anti-anti-sigma factor